MLMSLKVNSSRLYRCFENPRMSPIVNTSRLYGCFENQTNPTKVARSTSKQMIVCFFFEKAGHVAIVPLEQRRTVNSECNTIICLPVVFQEIGKPNRQRWITLHHDNASSHTLAQTTAFLITQNIDLMSHPAYSPDLAPNDLFLFPYVKIK